MVYALTLDLPGPMARASTLAVSADKRSLVKMAASFQNTRTVGMQVPTFGLVVFVASLLLFLCMKVQSLDARMEKLHLETLKGSLHAKEAPPPPEARVAQVDTRAEPADDVDGDMIRMLMQQSIARAFDAEGDDASTQGIEELPPGK